jgi:hypothetical protein
MVSRTDRHKGRHRGLGRGSVGLPVILLLMSACSGDDAPSTDTDDAAVAAVTTTVTDGSALPPCSEARHMVVFDFFGTLTMDDRDVHEAVAWIQDPNDEPRPRPGGPELAQAYRDLGYEILIFHTAQTFITIGDQPIDDAITAWLSRHGYPADDGVRVMGWDASGNTEDENAAILAVMDVLLRLSLTEDVSLDYGYTRAPDRAHFLASGGIPQDNVYLVGSDPGASGTTVVPEDDLTAHIERVRALGPVCQTA